jgi:hypothetical protein
MNTDKRRSQRNYTLTFKWSVVDQVEKGARIIDDDRAGG